MYYAQYDCYTKLTREMANTYNEKDVSHEAVLRDLFNNVIEDDKKQSADEMLRTEAWKDIGFQGKDPRTDFRAGGLLALLCLHYYVGQCRR